MNMKSLEWEYAFYDGDTFISCGTVKEISDETGITVENLRFYSTPAYEKRCPNGRKLIRLETETLSDAQAEYFADTLRKVRKEHKLSRNDMSKKLGYSEATINKWENKVHKANLFNVEDVATYFKLPIEFFLGKEE